VSRLNIGQLAGVREDDTDNDNGESKNWGLGRHGNLDLHGWAWAWAFDRFSNILEYKPTAEGIEVGEVSERDTSKT
jgi:hypothetical protein